MHLSKDDNGMVPQPFCAVFPSRQSPAITASQLKSRGSTWSLGGLKIDFFLYFLRVCFLAVQSTHDLIFDGDENEKKKANQALFFLELGLIPINIARFCGHSGVTL